MKELIWKNLRIAAICILAFAGFFRYKELANIEPRHIDFSSYWFHLKVFPSSMKITWYSNTALVTMLRDRNRLRDMRNQESGAL